MKVLFVDEDLDVQRLVEALATHYTADEFKLARNIREAVEELSTTKFDIVVVDMWLPPDENVLNGTAEDAGICAGIKVLEFSASSERSVNHKTKTVIFSGLVVADHEKVHRLWTDRQADFFRKPMHPERLYNELRNRVEEAK